MSSAPYPLPPSHPHHKRRCLPGTSYTSALRNNFNQSDTDGSMLTSGDFKEDNGKHSQPSTLDKLHHQHVNAMITERDKFERLTKQLACDKNKLSELKMRDLSDLSDTEMQTLFDLETTVANTQTTIDNYEKNGPFTDYFMKTGDILFEYYENLDQISKGQDDRRKRSLDSYSSNNAGKPTVIDFFKKKQVESTSKTSEQNEPKIKDGTENCENDSPRKDKEPVYQSRQVLLNKFRERTDPDYMPENDDEVMDTLDTDICPDCGTERFLVQYEATLICPNPHCARTDVILIDSGKPSYKDAPREGASYYSYKRINHFNEWLAQFQAKETTDIPDDVYHKIYIEIKKERIKNVANITPAKMKEILKRLKLNKYYEHIPHITNRINGQPAPVMDRKTEEKLRSMFKEIQSPFLKHCPPERKNFLSYSYVLHKFCQLLGLDDFLKCFQLLKSREKLHQQDLIWEKICSELQWEFIKSV